MQNAFGSREFRNILGTFATGITVITARSEDGKAVGITANSFSSVSLDPPMVSFCLDRGAWSFPIFTTAPNFAINVLSEGQEALSQGFARHSEHDKFEGLDIRLADSGCPLLPDCLSYLDCERINTVDAGDHVILIGRVLSIGGTGDGKPLLYYRGRYARIDQPTA